MDNNRMATRPKSKKEVSFAKSAQAKSGVNPTANAIIGDLVNGVVLTASVVYVVMIVYYTQPNRTGVLDEVWKGDGFCIRNKDVPYWSSFDVCFYVDVGFSLVLAAMYAAWKKLPGMETASQVAPMVIISTVGHGAAHWAMAAKYRDGSYVEVDASQTPWEENKPAFWQLAVFCAGFWFPLLKATMPKMSSATVAMLSILCTVGPLLMGGLKKELAFPYVQTLVSVAFHSSQLMAPSEDKSKREYVTLPISAILPMLVAWVEALFCTSFFRSAGGHALYDASIIVSYIVFYVDCYRHSLKAKTE